MKFKPGDKFIIEIDRCIENCAPPNYGIKNCTFALFNETHLCNLEPYSKAEEYQRGLDDAWEAVKTMYRSITVEELRKMFPIAKTKSHYWIADAIMDEYTAAEAIAKIRAYEEEREIKVGDELYFDDWPENKYVATRIPPDDEGRINYIDFEGKTYSNNVYAQAHKTGRHFPEVATLLEKLKEDAPDV